MLGRLSLRRIGLGLLTLWLVSLIVFAAVLALPGDAATAILGKEATPDRVAALRDQLNPERLGDQSVLPVARWSAERRPRRIRRDAGAGERPAVGRVGNSVFLVLVASLVAIPLSLFIGVWTAMRRDRPVDHITSTVTLVLAALPEFVIGIALVLLFATSVFHVLPAVSLLPPGTHAWEDPTVVVLRRPRSFWP